VHNAQGGGTRRPRRVTEYLLVFRPRGPQSRQWLPVDVDS